MHGVNKGIQNGVTCNEKLPSHAITGWQEGDFWVTFFFLLNFHTKRYSEKNPFTFNPFSCFVLSCSRALLLVENGHGHYCICNSHSFWIISYSFSKSMFHHVVLIFHCKWFLIVHIFGMEMNRFLLIILMKVSIFWDIPRTCE